METCIFCNSSQNDVLKFGRLITVDNVTVHHYCLVIIKICSLIVFVVKSGLKKILRSSKQQIFNSVDISKY